MSQERGLTPTQKALIVLGVMSRPAAPTVPYFYRPKCDRAWYLRLVGKSNLRRQAEQEAAANERLARMNGVPA